jgi:hypothetical protein
VRTAPAAKIAAAAAAARVRIAAAGVIRGRRGSNRARTAHQDSGGEEHGGDRAQLLRAGNEVDGHQRRGCRGERRQPQRDRPGGALAARQSARGEAREDDAAPRRRRARRGPREPTSLLLEEAAGHRGRSGRRRRVLAPVDGHVSGIGIAVRPDDAAWSQPVRRDSVGAVESQSPTRRARRPSRRAASRPATASREAGVFAVHAAGRRVRRIDPRADRARCEALRQIRGGEREGTENEDAAKRQDGSRGGAEEALPGRGQEISSR